MKGCDRGQVLQKNRLAIQPVAENLRLALNTCERLTTGQPSSVRGILPLRHPGGGPLKAAGGRSPIHIAVLGLMPSDQGVSTREQGGEAVGGGDGGKHGHTVSTSDAVRKGNTSITDARSDVVIARGSRDYWAQRYIVDELDMLGVDLVRAAREGREADAGLVFADLLRRCRAHRDGGQLDDGGQVASVKRAVDGAQQTPPVVVGHEQRRIG